MNKTFILKNRITVNRKKKKKKKKDKKVFCEKRSSCAYFYYKIKFDIRVNPLLKMESH